MKIDTDSSDQPAPPPKKVGVDPESQAWVCENGETIIWHLVHQPHPTATRAETPKEAKIRRNFIDEHCGF